MSTSSQLSVVTQPKLEIRVRAERRTGELLRETSQNGQRAKAGIRGPSVGRGARPTVHSAPLLNDHGISKDQSSDWQKLADQTFSALGQQETETESPHDPDLWRTGSPKLEALSLHALLGRNGDSIESLRALITVSPAEQDELGEWARRSPSLRGKIENMLRFRQAVLLEFDRLLENTHRGDSSRPLSA